MNTLKQWMRVAGFVALSAIALVATADTSVKNGRFTFALKDLNGKQVRHNDWRFKGKVVLVNIWGTWCPPCRVETPYLVNYYKKYRGQGFEIVGIAFERGSPDVARRKLKEFVKRAGIEYPTLYGGSTRDVLKKLPQLKGFNGFPTTILIDRDGKVRRVDVGFLTSRAVGMERAIVEMLGETSRIYGKGAAR